MKHEKCLGMKYISYRTRTMIGFWNVKTLLEDGSQTQENSRYLQLFIVFYNTCNLKMFFLSTV